MAWGSSEEFEKKRDQVYMEMAAVNGALQQLTEFNPQEQCLLVAIDADAVTHAIGKGYSGSPQIRKELQLLREQGAVIRARRVPGERNLADLPSRGVDPARALAGALGPDFTEDAERRRQATWEVLLALQQECR